MASNSEAFAGLADSLEKSPVRPALATALDRRPLDEHSAESALVSVLEDISAHGYPSPEAKVPWETTCDNHLARLTDEQARVA